MLSVFFEQFITAQTLGNEDHVEFEVRLWRGISYFKCEDRLSIRGKCANVYRMLETILNDDDTNYWNGVSFHAPEPQRETVLPPNPASQLNIERTEQSDGDGIIQQGKVE